MEAPLDVNNPAQKEQLRRLFRVKSTEGEMMLTRGYVLNPVYLMRSDRSFVSANLSWLQDINIPFDVKLQFRQQYGVFLSRQEFSSVYTNADGTKQILVLYLGNEPGKQVAKKDFQIVHDFIQTKQYHNIILITETGLNPENTNFIRNRTSGYNIEVFLDVEMAFNRTKHALAPISINHIPSSQISQWAQQENLQPEKLPMMLNIDTVAKWYGAHPLDVVDGECMGVTTDTQYFARIVRQTPAAKK